MALKPLRGDFVDALTRKLHLKPISRLQWAGIQVDHARGTPQDHGPLYDRDSAFHSYKIRADSPSKPCTLFIFTKNAESFRKVYFHGH
jgi:hypothetical protein